MRHKLRNKSSFGSKRLHFCDNLSAVLCACKGRSSSYPMLRASRLVAANCQLFTHWIPSEWNVADHGSCLWESERVAGRNESKRYQKALKKQVDFERYPNSKGLQECRGSQVVAPISPSKRLASIRHQLDGKNAQDRASKGQKFLSTFQSLPRFPGQTFLEQVAVSREVGQDYVNRTSAFFQLAATQLLPLSPIAKLDCQKASKRLRP